MTLSVIARNVEEYTYLTDECKRQGKMEPRLTEPDKYPIVFCYKDNEVFWTYRLDVKHLHYVEFEAYTKGEYDEYKEGT